MLVPLAIKDLQLYQQDELHGDSTPSEWHRHSTLDSAALRFITFNRPRWTLPRDEVLRLEGIRHGRIESVGMAGGAVMLRVTAEVSDVLVGNGRLSIQPTWLEALHGRSDLAALSTAVASLVAFVLMLARHWSAHA
jgi:hypothetical protein